MNNKHFNVSYETVRSLIKGTAFVALLWYLINKYFEKLISPLFFESLIGGLPFTTPDQLLVVIIWAAVLIIVVYLLAEGIVNLLYWFLGYKTSQTKWYPYLKEFDIKIPLTKNYYWKIKNNPKFTNKYPKYPQEEVKKEPFFSNDKLNDWATKIIEKELDRLVKSKDVKKTKNEPRIPLKEDLQWENLK